MWNVDIELIELIEVWLAELDVDSREQVVAAIELLEDSGPQLGRPIVDTVKASRHKNIKELRPGSSGKSELRILFAFDPERAAIMLIAGDKAGDWQGWYEKNLPHADRLFDEHLDKIRGK
ncbi:diaminopimelate decarboxylase [Glutamicibacter halophytocola]|uniref:Diaminopimelate decarboxylase n=1 Tax=Glutamicibacter halophytocola TaxID=1933880 RepID=A0ABX5Y6S2_9MICC|nr:diaminopimelate decarboxylase [Glutamicibacter halophytocola]